MAMSCAELAHRLQVLQNLLAHVHDPEQQAAIADEISAVESQMQDQGCLDSQTRYLSGLGTLWGFVDGTKTVPDMRAQLVIETSSGTVTWTLQPFVVSTSTYGDVTVHQPDHSDTGPGPYLGSGSFDAAQNNLGVGSAILGAASVSGFGVQATGELFVSTTGVIETPDGQAAGAALDANGNLTLVGSASLDAPLNHHWDIQAKIVGALRSFSPPPN